MNKTIEISDDLYQRLSLYVNGFETPASVIERIVTFYEVKHGVKNTTSLPKVSELPMSLDITYYPADEENFKQQLLQKKVAYLLLHKLDGTKELKEWNAINITNNSNINGNLRSGYLRDWKKKGIVSAKVSTNRNDLS
jgi:hypothetical protein